MNGYLLVDKPREWTSFDVVAKVRGILQKSSGHKVKVGHAGTLDPLATGLLIILIGDACKQANLFLKLDKSYVAEITLGKTSNTDDAEGELQPGPSKHEPSEDKVRAVLAEFVGKQQQIPPRFSAIKVAGRRAYKAARAGQEVELSPRTIEIYECRQKLYKYPILQIETHVSSGTYIRSLARDIGQKLGTGAYISSLRRTEIDEYKIVDAVKIDSLDVAKIRLNLKAVQ